MGTVISTKHTIKSGRIRTFKVTLLTAILSLVTVWTPSFGDASGVHATVESLKRTYQRPRYTMFGDNANYSPQIATLGKMLFFDPRLSKTENMSCASCHNPSFGWEAPVAKSIGAMNKKLSRHAPTIINLSDAKHLTWNGRETSLERQAEKPITNPQEMDNNFEDLVKRLSGIKSYKKWFDTYFPERGLTKDTILQSIATFERVLQSGPAPFDRWIEGDETAISKQAQKGFMLFNKDFGCAKCHSGWNFTDHSIQDTGYSIEDIGAGELEPNRPKAMYAFKTPGLREIASRAPYMHNGETKTLEGVIDFYATGGIKRESHSDHIKPFNVSAEERRSLVAFLKTLTSDDRNVQTPTLPAD